MSGQAVGNRVAGSRRVPDADEACTGGQEGSHDATVPRAVPRLAAWQVGSAAQVADTQIRFRGANNRVHVDDGAKLDKLPVVFDCDNGVLEIGPSRRVPSLALTIRVGQDSTVRIGRNVSSTPIVSLSATAGTQRRDR